ncbi:hypothetical protein LTR05_005138 [Lithohypha guttulata]|uniref:Tr-type G domain-containing protein n=1 Tax=Lithohypha guttulata TaxID=1690604 RepID=A0AAN7T0D7_9EURO|nr:hypothetical protein LTR05_005138 [Lithohypha guttulata]
MASIFTYQEEPHRVHSPWSTPGSNTPQLAVHVQYQDANNGVKVEHPASITKLEPEKHDGPIEYKLHLLLRWRRTFTHTSTTMPAWANQQGRIESTCTTSPPATDAVPSRTTYQPSTQNRQARLQQLTTQLLWRLQQSSPFHSSSNAQLVLPVLPEATPRLGVPERPSKLLPGLEESQGALYEIGVADDGTLIGLADEEMEESLVNLRAMAASLGCVVDVHRRVIVGDCEWTEEEDGQSVNRSSRLWVAEVLVRPDNKTVEVIPSEGSTLRTLNLEPEADSRASADDMEKQHLRIAIVGASAAGKSSLLGTLTTSVLDNGRGKSRLSLLKHRHEIASGITSSVAQELLGYQSSYSLTSPVVNYASGDVSSWPDIHNLADRLVFLSDSPGLPRYSKSTFRALLSWKPSWTVLCMPADETLEQPPLEVSDYATRSVGTTTPDVATSNLAMAHLDLCLRLGLPIIVAITKMDLATKSGLRSVLSQILSSVKAAGRSPVLMNAPSASNIRREEVDFSAVVQEDILNEAIQVEQKLNPFTESRHETFIPLVMTSALTGSGVASLHALLRVLPPNPVNKSLSEQARNTNQVIFRTDEVFAIPPSRVYSTTAEREVGDSGVVLCGVLSSGKICLGDRLMLGPFLVEADSGDTKTMTRTASYHAKSLSRSLPRSLSENFARSMELNGQSKLLQEADTKVVYVEVVVVSLRNLRLPVTSLLLDDTGTVGIQAVENAISRSVPLHKARKGMVLASPSDTLLGYSSFTASFPSSDFAGSGSPPLILGGHAIAYINSTRAVVKVVAVALEDDQNGHGGLYPAQDFRQDDVFCFDDEETNHNEGAGSATGHLRISFNFVNTVEFLTLNDQVLVIPNVTPAGPVAGPAPVSTIPGISGFVGRICEMRE